MLSVERLYSGYGRGDVLHDVSFTLKPGGRLYIAGSNGCGKTTLLKCIAGLLPHRGRVALGGREVERFRRRELAKKLGILTQLSSVSFPYTVFDTVALGRYAHQTGLFTTLSAGERERVEACLVRVGLADLRNRSIGELSGGQLQRVYLARLFAQDPELVLLDEPTNHLDLKYQIELLEYVTEWSQREGKTIIGVLHDLNLVHTFAERVILLHEGRVRTDGPPAEALSDEALRHCYGLDIRGWMRNSLARWCAEERDGQAKESERGSA